MERLFERAAVAGLETEYRDAFGRIQAVEPSILSRLLDAFPGMEPTAQVLPRSYVVRRGSALAVRLNAREGLPVRWRILSAAGCIAEGHAVCPLLTLPPDLADGIYRLAVRIDGPTGPTQTECSFIVSPQRASQGREDAPRRMWALALQLYAVRSRRNWGHGDFSDLVALVDIAASMGASAIALNPLHVLFPGQASPYSPNSRLFLNPLYIDVEAVPEFPGIEAAGLGDGIAALQAQDLVDYEGVAAAKSRALRLTYEAFCRSCSVERRTAFEKFRREQAPALSWFAAFEVLRRRFHKPWREWSDEWRKPQPEALARLQAGEAAEIAYVEFEQWLAHQQLDHCRALAGERGLPIGLFLDVAVGVCSDGFDAWYGQDTFLPRVSLGAPPDVLNTEGQNWGLAAFNPEALQVQGFEPFCRMLAASMRYAGAIRLDHILGLKRIYVIPEGMPGSQGAYLRYPFESMLATTVLLSVQHQCIVVGEDLGTVPDNFRETLADWGVWSYQVMLFERAADGSFVAPDSYRENALVTFTTHDLPTFAGWMSRRDLDMKQSLGLNPGETGDERRAALDALRQALGQRGLMHDNFAAVAQYLGATPSRLLVIGIEDVLRVAEQINIPGTIDEHPNWRRRLPVGLEELQHHRGLREIADILRWAGRAFADAPQK